MAKKVSSGAQRKLDTLGEATRKYERIYSLVEQFANSKSNTDHFLMSISRAATDVGRVLLIGGFGVIADGSNALAMAAKRGGSHQSKCRNLRELCAGNQAALERAVKGIMDAEKKAAAEKATQE